LLARTEPRPIDYSVNVPRNVIGHFCYWDKCVWFARVISIQYAAARLAYPVLLSKQAMSRRGLKWSPILRDSLFKYIHLRRYGAGHTEAFSVVPEEYRSKYVEKIVRTVYEDSEKIVRRYLKNAPPTGFRYFHDETLTKELLFFRPEHVLRILDISKGPERRVYLGFCDEEHCYPVRHGFWPRHDWLDIIAETVRHDVYYELLQRYGAVDALDYILGIDTDEVAVNIKPGKLMTRIYIYVYTDTPGRHAVRLTEMQEVVARVIEQLEEIASSFRYEKEAEEIEDIGEDELLEAVLYGYDAVDSIR